MIIVFVVAGVLFLILFIIFKKTNIKLFKFIYRS
jgi:hypothetical protein